MLQLLKTNCWNPQSSGNNSANLRVPSVVETLNRSMVSVLKVWVTYEYQGCYAESTLVEMTASTTNAASSVSQHIHSSAQSQWLQTVGMSNKCIMQSVAPPLLSLVSSQHFPTLTVWLDWTNKLNVLMDRVNAKYKLWGNAKIVPKYDSVGLEIQYWCGSNVPQSSTVVWKIRNVTVLFCRWIHKQEVSENNWQVVGQNLKSHVSADWFMKKY